MTHTLRIVLEKAGRVVEITSEAPSYDECEALAELIFRPLLQGDLVNVAVTYSCLPL